MVVDNLLMDRMHCCQSVIACTVVQWSVLCDLVRGRVVCMAFSYAATNVTTNTGFNFGHLAGSEGTWIFRKIEF